MSASYPYLLADWPHTTLLRLPKIQSEVATQLERCNQALEDMPKAITADPASYVLTLVTEFSRDVAQYVNGGEISASGLVQRNRATYAQYKRTIRASAPPFMPYPNAKSARGVNNREIYLKLAGEGEDEDGDGEDGIRSEDAQGVVFSMCPRDRAE